MIGSLRQSNAFARADALSTAFKDRSGMLEELLNIFKAEIRMESRCEGSSRATTSFRNKMLSQPDPNPFPLGRAAADTAREAKLAQGGANPGALLQAVKRQSDVASGTGKTCRRSPIEGSIGRAIRLADYSPYSVYEDIAKRSSVQR